MKLFKSAKERAFEKQLDEALKIYMEKEFAKYDNIELPEIEFSDEHKRKMEALFERARNEEKARRERIRKRNNVIKFAVAAMVAVVTLTAIVPSVFNDGATALPIKFFNFIYDKDAPNSDFSFSDEREDKISNDWVTFEYVPKNFSLSNEKNTDNSLLMYFTYDNKNFCFSVKDISMKLSIDTENAEVEKLKINGYEAMYLEKSDVNMLIWHDSVNCLSITGNIERNEIIKIAENIIINKK